MRYVPHILPILILGCGMARTEAQEKKGGNSDAQAPKPAVSAAPCPVIVFVVDGAGGHEHLSAAIKAITWRDQLPLAVATIPWSHHEGVIKDHEDILRQMRAAAGLAYKVSCLRKAHPRARVVLIGYSTGSHVALLAAGMLPEKSVDRVILLGASVSHGYDLRTALKTSKEGIDNFWSPEDGVLEMAEESLGTADQKYLTPMAGRVGFTALPRQTPDADLYCNLRQYKWNANFRFTPNGGHFGWTRVDFLRCSVVPMLVVPMLLECAPSKK